MKVTVETIAERLGISKATVSYALTGKNRVSRELKEKILTTAKELGYKPSALARNLVSRKTWTIGLYAPDSAHLVEDIYFNSVLSGILDLLHHSGYNLQLFPSYADSKIDDMLHLDTHQALDGLLIMDPRLSTHYLDEVRSMDLPFVLVGLPREIDEDVFYVDFDLAASAYIAVTHLLDRGRKRIGFINSPEAMIQSVHRMNGFARAFAERELPASDLVEYAGPSLEEGHEACRRLLEREPAMDALAVYNDLPAVGAAQALREARRRIPTDTALVSGGNTIVARIHSPSLTSVDPNPYRQGYRSAELLIEVVEKKRMRPTHDILPVQLVEREST
ncbi:MAG: LacI family DNA-binding transcriptional regulator [Rectinemataceae bacterium]